VRDVESAWISKKQRPDCLPPDVTFNRIEEMVFASEEPSRSDHSFLTSMCLFPRALIWVCEEDCTALRTRLPIEVVRHFLSEGFEVSVSVDCTEDADIVQELRMMVDIWFCSSQSLESRMIEFDPSVVVCCGAPTKSADSVYSSFGIRPTLIAGYKNDDDSCLSFDSICDRSDIPSTLESSDTRTWLRIARQRATRCCNRLNITKNFFIRIDDVFEMNTPLKEALTILGTGNIGTSLEIIPYFCNLEASDLDMLNCAPKLLEVGQHGYSHLQRGRLDGSKSEFDLDNDAPSEQELYELRRGILTLKEKFGGYFKGGFSAPFDALPSWLPEAWQQLGGTFLSVMRNLPIRGRVPVVRALVETWNWERNCRRSDECIWEDVYSSLVRIGYVGLVLHRQHLQNQADIDWLVGTLETFRQANFSSRAVSTFSSLQSQNISTSAGRSYTALPNEQDNPGVPL
jgi:hypothetical protein